MNRRDHIRAFLTLCLMREASLSEAAPTEDGSLRTHLLTLIRAVAAQEQAERARAGAWSALTRALAEQQPEARLRSLAGTWLSARTEEARAGREVQSAVEALQGAVSARRGEP